MGDTFTFVRAGEAASPGSCLICGFDRRDFIDFRRDMEYYGAVLVCISCINELGTVPELDFVSRIDYEEQVSLNQSQSETIRSYEGLRKKLEDGLVRVANDFTVDFDSTGINRRPALQGKPGFVKLVEPAKQRVPEYLDPFGEPPVD
jgi:hypothetical protein